MSRGDYQYIYPPAQVQEIYTLKSSVVIPGWLSRCCALWGVQFGEAALGLVAVCPYKQGSRVEMTHNDTET